MSLVQSKIVTEAAVTVGTTVETSQETSVAEFSKGSIQIGGSSTLTKISIYGNHIEGGDFGIIRPLGVPVQVETPVRAGSIIPLDEEVFTCRAIKIVGDVADTVSVLKKTL